MLKKNLNYLVKNFVCVKEKNKILPKIPGANRDTLMK